ncbi:hypothetical protein GCM10027046_13340 [Uliginosibacterium flavum]|uniref:protein acetyllysine N-acetyltransferase n=1 Tax=Uliginosibacterium flavum TaxID=1396831 RepID=A0ABV2TPZ6_9RHOO
MTIDMAIKQAVSWLREADGLVITAGAGMGVDSGLPDFRGSEGFWQAYPALKQAGVDFRQIANPDAFRSKPLRAWGFYGHRLKLYRETVPHRGFAILQALSAGMPHGHFVFTSNVDGQFQKAGFSQQQIVECHGSIHFLQCMSGCEQDVWSADRFKPVVDEAHCALSNAMPVCPYCGVTARPNILMFNDWNWVSQRTQFQGLRLNAWRQQLERPVVIELGAGTAIPSVRVEGELFGAPLIRINPREAEVKDVRAVSIPLGALAGLELIEQAWRG